MSIKSMLAKIPNDVNAIQGNTPLIRNGVRAEKYFNREGFASSMDQNAVKKNLENRKNAIGSGSYRVAVVDDKGKVIPEQLLNFNGRMHSSNTLGVFNMVDTAYLQEQKRVADEEKKYINTIVSYCMASDDAFATVCGLPINDLRRLCQPNGCDAINDGSLPPSINAMDCSPNVLKLLDSGSLLFSQSISKARWIIGQYAPILDSETGTNKAVADETS